MSLTEAFAAALGALSGTGNGERNEIGANQLEVAILDRTREHRTFRRIRAARLAELISQARPASQDGAPETAPEAPSDSSEPATGPDASDTDRGGGVL